MLNFNPSVLAPCFTWGDALVTPSFSQPILLLPLDSLRVYVRFSIASGTITIRPQNFTPLNQGITLNNSLPPVEFKYSDVGTLCGYEWWVGAGGGVGAVYVIWVSFDPGKGA